MEILTQLAHGALALLVCVLAIYLSLRLLGRIAKFVITLIVIAAVLWFIFSENSILQSIQGFSSTIPSWKIFS